MLPQLHTLNALNIILGKNYVIHVIIYQLKPKIFFRPTTTLCNDFLFLFKANLAKQEGRLAVANAELGKAQALLDEKQGELDKVQAKFDAAMNEKMVRLNLQKCRNEVLTLSTSVCCILKLGKC